MPAVKYLCHKFATKEGLNRPDFVQGHIQMVRRHESPRKRQSPKGAQVCQFRPNRARLFFFFPQGPAQIVVLLLVYPLKPKKWYQLQRKTRPSTVRKSVRELRPPGLESGCPNRATGGVGACRCRFFSMRVGRNHS